LPNKVLKIVSGGQTGVDRAALDFAIENGFEYGGFVPAGRVAEDGEIPHKYNGLVEIASSDPAERTRLNILYSDATLLVTHGEPAGGSKLTLQFARELKKPVLHIDLAAEDLSVAVEKARQWLEITPCRSLNIAGPRGSEDGRIYGNVVQLLTAMLVK